VRALTRRGMGGASSQIKHGPLIYDQSGRVATIDGKMVELSARELGLLEVLLQRAGRLVSKDQLVERLCEWGEEVSNNAIEVYIHRLRKKIEKGPIRIVTGDRDLFQMVDDKRDIKVIYLAKGISQHDLVDYAYVANKYSIPGDRYALFAMFRGDPSDGLPGVRGIGEKGAALIANAFANVDDALAAALAAHDSLPPALAKKIIAGADYLKIAPTVVQVARNAPLPQVDLAMPKAPKDLSDIYQFKERYGLGASVDRLISALGW